MGKKFKYLLTLLVTIMSLLPTFVFAEENNTFDSIYINKDISLIYTVLGDLRTYTNTFDTSLTGLKIYTLDKDTDDKTEIDLDDVEYISDTRMYRINGVFNKSYNNSNENVKYLIKYSFDVNVNDSIKTVDYTEEYSYDEDLDGILVNLTKEDSVKSFAPSIVINKCLTSKTPNGTFKFNIKDTSDNIIKTVTITTTGGENGLGGSGSATVEDLNINTSYIVEEIDIPDKYQLVSMVSEYQDTSITLESENAIAVTNSSIEDIMTITVTNKIKDEPEHSKELSYNGNGTYQLALNVKGAIQAEDINHNANVLIVYDVSSSMTSNYIPNKTGARGLTTSYGSTQWIDLYYYNTTTRRYVNLVTANNNSYEGTVYRRISTNNYQVYTDERYDLTAKRSTSAEAVLKNFINDLSDNVKGDLLISMITFSATANNVSVAHGISGLTHWTSTISDITGKLGNNTL